MTAWGVSPPRSHIHPISCSTLPPPASIAMPLRTFPSSTSAPFCQQRQLIEAKRRDKRMQSGMMKANDDRPRSARKHDDATKPLMTGATNRGIQQAPYGECDIVNTVSRHPRIICGFTGFCAECRLPGIRSQSRRLFHALISAVIWMEIESYVKYSRV